MAVETRQTIDPRNGYCSSIKIYHSLRDASTLPPETTPLSITDFVFSLLHSYPNFSLSSPFLIDSATHLSLSYSELLRRVDSLSFSLSRHRNPTLSAGNVALILSPSSFHIPVLYLSLLSLGVVVSPANPLSTQSELTYLLELAKPSVIFAVSSLSSKLQPCNTSNVHVVFLDTPEFDSMLTHRVTRARVEIPQSTSAVILYSSGTTGRVKGVELTHRNFIALISGFHHLKMKALAEEIDKKGPAVCLFLLPLFHSFGVFILLRAVVMAQTVVLMTKFDLEMMMEAVERYRVTYIPVSPPLVVALGKSELAKKYDLSSLELVSSGGAPLSKEVAERFKARFPNVRIQQGYGMTETGGALASAFGLVEFERYGSVGRLQEHIQAKIVDPLTGDALPPGQQGELWVRGPSIMKGYVDDKEATAATFHPDGWLKTGDLCYFDTDGYLYIVDRLKELIKYKAYQVAPAELERLLLLHPEIADAAVIPYPDEEAGQIPMAFVVRRPESSITASQVMDYVAKEVSPYKRIRRVSFVNAIPKNPSGKILRRELINQATASPSKL